MNNKGRSTDVTQLPLGELARLIERRQLSPVELTKAYLNRIERIDPLVHSFNAVRSTEALAEAEAAERSIMAGERIGPLHGIPIGIKDLIDVEGMPTTAQAAHRRGHVAMRDADVVRSLKASGAIILGKQATAEYAMSGTSFRLPWPPTRNPWNLDLDPSSSSSGSAASVAAGLCAGSVGTETASSIRDPAAWCGVAGLKPTNGLVSRRGVFTLSPTMDCVGPLAWTVEDCSILLAGMTAVTADGAQRGFRNTLAAEGGIEGLRVGVVREFYEDDPHLDNDVLDAMERSLSAFEDLGALLSTVTLSDFDLYCATARQISWPEEYEEHRDELEAYPDRLTSVSRSRFEDGKSVSAADYIRARKQQLLLKAEITKAMETNDVLVLPTMKKPAQVLGYEHTELGEVDLSLTRPFNLTGGPSLAMCNGFSSDGRPTSIQIVGRDYEDQLVLKVGINLEAALGFRGRRPHF